MGNKASVPAEDIERAAANSNLSSKELKALVSQFSKMCDEDGLVRKDAFKQVIARQLGDNESSLAALVFNLFDADGSKTISFPEYVRTLSMLSSRSVEDAVDIAFRCCDLDGNGCISTGELKGVLVANERVRRYLGGAGDTVLDVSLPTKTMADLAAKAERLMFRIDQNGDKQITYDEFQAALQSDDSLRQEIESILMRNTTAEMMSPRGISSPRVQESLKKGKK